VFAATPVVELHHGVDARPVTLVAGYLLDPNGHVSTTKGVQQTDMHWDYTERSGAQQVRPFGYLAFRYLEVAGAGAGEALGAGDITVDTRHASMPDEQAATFRSSDPRVNAVWELARHSALYDTQEQFLDTPTREHGQFLLDAFNVSQATMAAFGERQMTFEALNDFAHSQRRYWPDGRVNAVYPNGDGKRDIPDFTETYVEWVWRAWETTGDRTQLASLYPVVQHIAAYVARAIDRGTGLVTNLPGGSDEYRYGIVDWPPNMRYGYDMNTVARTTENILAVDVFRRTAQIADALRRPSGEARTANARAAALTAAIRDKLVRAAGVFVDGRDGHGAMSAHASQQANAYALAYNIVPSAHVKLVADYVVSLGNATGVDIFTTLLDGLHRAGRDDALLVAITDPNRPGYARILQQGATFTWESWDARQTGDSESHGWGSAVLAVLQHDVLGVTVTAPGAARIDVRPPATRIARASGRAPTQRGPVDVSWARSHDDFALDLTVPANMTATAHVPAAAVAQVFDGARPVRDVPGVASARAMHGEVTLTLGSGHYVLRAGVTQSRSSSRGGAGVVAIGLAGLVTIAAAALAISMLRRARGSH
jgi:alpha-L-rhamnosidase